MTCLTFAATPLVGSIDPATGAVFGTFLGFSSAALLLIGESARRTVGIVYLNENKDKVIFILVTQNKLYSSTIKYNLI